MAIDATERELHEAQGCTVKVFVIGLFDELFVGILEDRQLGAVFRLTPAHPILDLAQRIHGLGILENQIVVFDRKTPEYTLGIFELLFHPDA